MKYRIEIYNQSKEDEWDNFVQQAPNGTLFHERKFINYHPSDRFKDMSLMIYHKDKLVSVFPAALLNNNDKIILKSHPGTSYGGFVIPNNFGLADCFDLLQSLDEFIISQNINKVEFRHGPKIFNQILVDQLDFALVKNGFYRHAEELATCYPLSQYRGLDDIAFLNSFNNLGIGKAKQSVKKGIAQNLQVRFFDDDKTVNDFYNILKANLTKHKTTPVHSLDEIKTLLKSYPNRVRLFGIFSDDILVSGFLTFVINTKGVHIFYSALDYNFQNIRPQSFGLFKLIQQITNEGYDYLNFGISTENSGTVINWGLFGFKESFNGAGAIRTYWVKEY